MSISLGIGGERGARRVWRVCRKAIVRGLVEARSAQVDDLAIVGTDEYSRVVKEEASVYDRRCLVWRFLGEQRSPWSGHLNTPDGCRDVAVASRKACLPCTRLFLQIRTIKASKQD